MTQPKEVGTQARDVLTYVDTENLVFRPSMRGVHRGINGLLDNISLSVGEVPDEPRQDITVLASCSHPRLRHCSGGHSVNA